MTGVGGSVETLRVDLTELESGQQGLIEWQRKMGAKIKLSQEYYTKKEADAQFADTKHLDEKFNLMQTTLAGLDKLIREVNGSQATTVSNIPLCPDPVAPTLGKWSYQIDNPDSHPKLPFVPGVSIYFECNEGYGIIGGKEGTKMFERLCNSDGKWYSPDKSQTGMPACEKCKTTTDYVKVDHTQYYSQTTGNARWGGKDFRSGSPGEDESLNRWVVGPLDMSKVTKLKFKYEYVTGYSWNCGFSKVTGYKDCTKASKFPVDGGTFNYGGLSTSIQDRFAKGPEIKVYIEDASNKDIRTQVYNSRKLEDYPYDNCGANGGWGETLKQGDGCYSPLVEVESTRQANGKWQFDETEDLPTCACSATAANSCRSLGCTGTYTKDKLADGTKQEKKRTIEMPNPNAQVDQAGRVKIVFNFANNGRNLHLNPHHLTLEVVAEAYNAEARACRV